MPNRLAILPFIWTIAKQEAQLQQIDELQKQLATHCSCEGALLVLASLHPVIHSLTRFIGKLRLPTPLVKILSGYSPESYGVGGSMVNYSCTCHGGV